MTPERFRRVDEIYHAADERSPAGRAAFLAQACGTDAELRRQVESLLAQDTSREGILERPPTLLREDRVGAGTQLGPYCIEASIGKGGMGEVWKARDSRLRREVAVKISTRRFSGHFEREARVIAALNHPNICTIHDVGPNYLVMELIEGPTLAERISRGPIPVEEALAIAKQIADALEAAHESGIVHRDLKPANIKIRPDGSVKVLDFGIAKATRENAAAAAASDSPTLTTPGSVVGTPGYMPPEQVRGDKVDKRADIWAFGVVLYEMTTGQRPFEGKTVSDTLASVIKENPNWARAPVKVQKLLRACLEKDPRRRLRDIGDIDRLLDAEAAIAAPSQPRFGKMGWIAAGVFALTAVVLAVHARIGQQPGSGSVARFTMEVAPAEMLGGREGFYRPSRTAVAFSPDGRTVVFSGGRGTTVQLYKRAINSLEAVAMPGTEGATAPFFSPDGAWLGFLADAKLKKVSMSGGPAVIICVVPGPMGRILGATWGSAGTIVFIPSLTGDLMRVSAAGGAPTVLLARDPAKGETYTSPQWLPGEKTLLYTARASDDWDDARIVARQIDTGQQRDLIKGGTDARYVPTGHLLYMRNSVLMAAPFDYRRVQLDGQPVALLDGVMQSVNASSSTLETGMGQFAVSTSGNLVYASGGIYLPYASKLIRVDRKGAVTELGAPVSARLALRISPDGQSLSFMKREGSLRTSEIWVYDLVRGTQTRLTAQGASQWPFWSPDGKRILFRGKRSTARFQTLSIPADGSGVEELISSPTKDSEGEIPAALSADGKWLAHLVSLKDGKSQIWVRPMYGEEERRLFLESKFSLSDAEFSPDGRWMLYVSNESGASEVYVQAFPGPGGKHRISPNFGVSPLWARNGRELFYTTKQANGPNAVMMAVDITPGDTFRAGAPHVLFEGNWVISSPMRSYDISPDGKYFIMARLEPLPDQRVTRLNVVLNWFDELKARAPRSPQ